MILIATNEILYIPLRPEFVEISASQLGRLSHQSKFQPRVDWNKKHFSGGILGGLEVCVGEKSLCSNHFPAQIWLEQSGPLHSLSKGWLVCRERIYLHLGGPHVMSHSERQEM